MAKMGKIEVQICIDQSPPGWIAELAERLSVLGEIIPRPVEIVELIRSIPDAGRINVKRLPADRADQVRVILEPSDAVLGLLTALRARNEDGQFVG